MKKIFALKKEKLPPKEATRDLEARLMATYQQLDVCTFDLLHNVAALNQEAAQVADLKF